MIANILGTVIKKEDDFLVIRVGGIGIQVFVPANVLDGTDLLEETELYTHLVVREDSLTLFGFSSEEELHLFKQLISVNGIGPKTGVNILSTLSIELIKQAVINEQHEVFSRVSGIGKKGAQKILIHLQDKISILDGASTAVIRVPEADLEIMDILTGMGFSIVQAQKAVQAIPKDVGEDTEERLRIALKFLAD